MSRRDDPTVHVIDDDEASRKATARLLQAAGHRVAAYPSATEFYTLVTGGPGCLVLDLRMPGPTGLELQDRLAVSVNPLPIVFLSGEADVLDAAHAFKAGAIDFLTKPANGHALLEAVGRALAKDLTDRAARERRHVLRARYERLTPREREVFAHVISGQLNKQTAWDLGTAEQTIKLHRRRVLAKLEADSVADLARVAVDLDIEPVGKVR